MDFNTDQKKVVASRDKNVLVSAAAGSGKTTVLVERIIRLIIDDKKDIDKFLVMTFTNAAAAGMRLKIQKALYNQMQEASIKEGQEDSIKHLRRQMNLLSKANISTIHSFCIKVLRDNFHSIDLDPSFRVGDDNECKLLLDESINQALDNAYREIAEKEENGENEESINKFKKLIAFITKNKTDESLVDLLREAHKFVQGFAEPMEWFEDKYNEFNSEDIEKEIMSLLFSHFNMIMDYWLNEFSKMDKICEQEDGPKKYKENIVLAIDKAEKLKAIIGTENIFKFIDCIENLELGSLNRMSSKDIVDEVKKQVVANAYNDFKKDLSKILELLPNKNAEELEKDNVFLKEILGEIKLLLGEVITIYNDKKKEKAIVDFNDLEHLAIKALSIKEIGDFYRKKFEYIYIDEYQDSNEIQETIVNKIKRENNVFMVGDAKQSIYKFRLADVSLINSKMETYKSNAGADEVNERIDLQENFRSKKVILDGTNAVFSKIMTKSLGELDYDDKVALNYGANFIESEEQDIELNIVEKIKGETDNEELQEMKGKEIEANLIVNRIEELVREGKIYDCVKENWRKIEYRDIVILARGVSSIAGVYENTFFKRNIPLYMEFDKGYYNSVEIKLVLDYLRLIDNFRQDIPLISVMYSPIGGFDLEELSEIRAFSPEGKYYSSVLKYYNEGKKPAEERNENIDVELFEKLSSFLETIYEYRDRSRYTAINELVWNMIIDSNYYYYVGTLVNGNVRQANLRLLVDKAQEYEKTSMSGLYNFLLYIEKLGIAEEDEGNAKVIGENDNVVKLMTIHKSKGLEFPVVILANSNSKFNKREFSNELLMHKKYGFAMKHRDIENKLYGETFRRAALKVIGEKEALSEEMRILYVAFTRAMNKLLIFGTVDSTDKAREHCEMGCSQYSVFKANSYFDWICKAVYKQDLGVNLYKKLQLGALGSDYDGINSPAVWKVNIFRQEDLEKTIATGSDNTVIVELDEFDDFKDKEIDAEVDKFLNYAYKYQNSINAPTKMSVTEIKNHKNNAKKDGNIAQAKLVIPSLISIDSINDNSLNNLKDKETEEQATIIDNAARQNQATQIGRKENQDLSGAQLGTLTHLVLQHVDLKKDLSNVGIKAQLKALENAKLISEEENLAIRTDKIAKFFQSPIGKRMVSSTKVRREAPFVIKEKGKNIDSQLDDEDTILVQGIIDCYFYENGEIVLIDYKTDSVSKDNEEKSEAQIISEYKEQLTEYKNALETLLNTKVKEAYLYLFSNNKELRIL